MEFVYGDVCLRYQYIVTAEEILSFRTGHAGWVTKVLQTKWKKMLDRGNYREVTPEKLAYRDFCTFVGTFKKDIKINRVQYTPEIITKVLLTYRETLKLKYPDAFAEESLGWYADTQLVKAYLRGELTSTIYNVQQVLTEQERIKVKLKLKEEQAAEVRKEQEILRLHKEQLTQEKYLSEKIPVAIGMVFRRKGDVSKVYVGKDVLECIKIEKVGNNRWEVLEVYVNAVVHPSLLAI